jgi:imidazolonepropionase-like amidohydrolase
MTIVFQDCRVIDGLGGAPREHCDVIVEGERLAAIEPARPRSAGEQQLLAAAGLTMLPGLIDCHSHYVLDPWAADPFQPAETEPVALTSLRAAHRARLALEAGVTTTRDAGAPRQLNFVLRDAIAAELVPGPRLLAPGLAITITGGHGHRFGREADGPVELQKAAREQMRDGADVIKIISSEAAMLTGAEAGVAELTQAEIEVIVQEARRRGLRTFSHAQSATAVVRSAQAGVHSVEHAFLANPEALRTLKACGTTLVPTLAVTAVTLERADIPEAYRQRMLDIRALHWASCEEAIRQGVNVVPGTDCGVTAILPTLLWREIALLHERGLSRMDALRAATLRAAELLGVDAQVGSLTPGKQADLILVAGDPLADLAHLSQVALVMRAGKIYKDQRPAPVL